MGKIIEIFNRIAYNVLSALYQPFWNISNIRSRGISYIYPILWRFGLIRVPKAIEKKMGKQR